MKIILIIALFITNIYAMSVQCEDLTIHATKIHNEYMNGKATITDSYNAANKMKKECGGEW